MGLEGTHHPFVAQCFGGGQQGLKLAGVMGIVIIDLRAMIFALVFKAAACADKLTQTLFHGLAGDMQHVGCGCGGKGVFHVMHTGDLQTHVGIGVAVYQHIKFAHSVDPAQPGGGHVPALQPEGESRTVKPGNGLHGVFVLGVVHHPARLRDEVGKGAEGALHGRQVGKVVQMVGIHIQDDRHRGEEGEEGVAILAGFQNNGVPFANPVSHPQHGQRAADHHRGVGLGGHEDVGTHGGGGGLAVGAGNAQGVGVVTHNGAPCLRPLEHGDAGGPGGGNFGIVVVDGGGADHALGALYTFRLMSDDHMDAHRAQASHRAAFLHIRAGDGQPGAAEHFGQRGHGYAADAHQMGTAAGTQIFVDVVSGHSNGTSFDPEFRRMGCAGHRNYSICRGKRQGEGRLKKALYQGAVWRGRVFVHSHQFYPEMAGRNLLDRWDTSCILFSV